MIVETSDSLKIYSAVGIKMSNETQVVFSEVYSFPASALYLSSFSHAPYVLGARQEARCEFTGRLRWQAKQTHGLKYKPRPSLWPGPQSQTEQGSRLASAPYFFTGQLAQSLYVSVPRFCCSVSVSCPTLWDPMGCSTGASLRVKWKQLGLSDRIVKVRMTST